MRSVALAVAMFLIATALIATAASAQGEHRLAAAIVVPAEASCLTHAALLEHTTNWLGQDTIDARTSVVVELGRDERFGVAFALLERGEVVARRTFERLPEACADRRAAFSLALAIALDASVLERLGASSESESGGTATADSRSDADADASDADAGADHDSQAEADSEAETDTEADTEAGSNAGSNAARDDSDVGRLHLDVAPDVAVAFGALPAWSWLGGFELAMRGRGWELRVGGRVSNRVRARVGSGQARIQLGVADLGACIHLRAGVAIRGCAGVALGRVAAEGTGFEEPRRVRLWWSALTAELSARWPAEGPVGVRFGVRGHAKIVRPTLRVSSSNGEVVAENHLSIGGVSPFLAAVFTFR